MQSTQLIELLIEQSKQTIIRVEPLKNEDLYTLTRKENPNAWSILECLEHLNLYGDFYLTEIENAIFVTSSKSEAEFKSGPLGNYFAKSMLPKEKLNKMKTFKDKNPLNARLDKDVIDKFLKQQSKLSDLLHRSKSVSLNKVKIKTSFSGLIRLKLGDTFQFYSNHIIRHLKQIDKIKAAMQIADVH